jgi:hypothetical protein
VERVKSFFRLYVTASAIVGAPVLAIILVAGLQRAFFTLTCEVADYKCSKAFGSKSTVETVIGSIVNDETDVVVKPRRKL